MPPLTGLGRARVAKAAMIPISIILLLLTVLVATDDAAPRD